ncbi:MAG: response regulator [Polyangiaceae bacterium]|nr:response regulator [Polyangiaceae bacterium]
MTGIAGTRPRARVGTKNPWALTRGGALLVVATVGMALLLRQSLNPLLEGTLPLVVFVIPVAICAALGGFWVGVLATATSAALGIYYFMQPTGQFDIPMTFQNVLRLGSFSAIGLIISTISGRLHKQIERLINVEQQVAAREAALRNVNAELERRTAELESFISHAPVGFALIDRDKRYIRANEALAKMTGLAPEELAGRSVADLTPPHQVAQVEGNLQHVFDTGETLQSLACTSGLPTHPGEERNLFLTMFPVRDSHGIVAVGGVTLDITDQKRAERAWRESDLRLRLALDAASAGTWDWDIVHDELTWSDTNYALYGRDPKTNPVTNLRSWLDSLLPDERAAEEAAAARTLARDPSEEDTYRAEFRIEHPQKGVRWLLGLGRVLRDDQGRPTRLIGINLDITDRKHTEESERAARAEAERLSRLKDEFLATISHELRTPLTAILGWTDILKRPKRDQEKLDRGLDVIERNARVLAQIVSDLLDVGRIVSGKMHLDASPVDLGTLTRGAIETIRPIAKAKGVTVRADIDPIEEPLLGDPARIEQIVWNLLSNAIKFTPRDGVVDVRVEARDEWAGITVSDTGQGIAPEFLPQLFQRFRQEDSSSSRKYGGLGLGLAIVKHLSELHGGRVSAESAGVGRGATFTVELPLARSSDQYALTSGTRTMGSTGGSTLDGIRVLVVEDEPDTRELVQRVLEESAAEVVSAASAAEALRVLDSARPDVLVSDIGMPGMDGYALLRAIRARSCSANGHPPLPAIALTAFARIEDRDRALDAGYAEHLTKPIDPGRLVTTVARLYREYRGRTSLNQNRLLTG